MPGTEPYSPDPYAPPVRRGGGVRNALLLMLLAFVLGIGAVVWAVTRWEPARRLVLPLATAPAQLTAGADPAAPVDEIVTPRTGASASAPAAAAAADVAAAEARVAGIEARIAQVDARAAGAAQNASRAEGLLVAFAVRRAIDRGAALGYLEAQLRDRFGTLQPRAVAAIITSAQTPVTLDTLRRDLDALVPALGGADAHESWLDAARRTIGTLVVVRRKEDPPPAPDARLARARRAIEAGQVDVALTEVARLPARASASDWMTTARRYIEAHRALDILEASALTSPAPAASAATNQDAV